MSDVARHTRWSVAALLAPATAAVFAGSVGWASANSPAPTAPHTTRPAAAPLSATDTDPGLESAVRAQIAQVEALRKQVAQLRQQVRALRSGTAAKKGITERSTTSTRPAPAPAPAQAAPPAPAPAPVRAPAPPPATHTTTGGS